MAEPDRPVGEPADDAPRPTADAPFVEPTSPQPAPAEPAARTGETSVLEPQRPVADETRTEVVEPAPATAVRPTPPAPTERQPVLAPAAESAPPPPRKQSNRIVGTAWVLLAAGIFELLVFGINALVVLVFVGPQAVASQVQSIAGTAIAWLPVLLFFLFFELTVLLINRAGRVAYVLASLILAVVVYVLTVLLFSLIVQHTLGDANTLAQTFLNWEFIAIGLLAREVSLWTGFAIGSRGVRVRRRNKEARRHYDEELADARS